MVEMREGGAVRGEETGQVRGVELGQMRWTEEWESRGSEGRTSRVVPVSRGGEVKSGEEKCLTGKWGTEEVELEEVEEGREAKFEVWGGEVGGVGGIKYGKVMFERSITNAFLGNQKRFSIYN